MVGDIISERWAASSWNGGRLPPGISTLPVELYRAQTVSRKKERSGLQSACDELIDKDAIITGE
jgi:hypothetical protein